MEEDNSRKEKKKDDENDNSLEIPVIPPVDNR